MPIFGSSAVAEDIHSAVKELFGDSIAVDSQSTSVLVNYVFAVYDAEKLNKLWNFLLAKEDVIDAVWKSFPKLDPRDYPFDGKARMLMDERNRVIQERLHVNGNDYNCTEPIPFSQGTLVPLDNSHREFLCEEVRKELDGENVSDEELRQELTVFGDAFQEGNQCQGDHPYFAILDDNGKIVGGIGLSNWSFISLDRGPNSYNFEYYIIPASRRKGLAKAACIAFVDALRNEKVFVYRNNPLLVYGVKPEPLPVKLLSAVIYSKNEASLRCMESLDCFEFCGNIKYMRKSERENGFVLDSVSLYTCVL